jgi:hypothetical protein
VCARVARRRAKLNELLRAGVSVDGEKGACADAVLAAGRQQRLSCPSPPGVRSSRQCVSISHPTFLAQNRARGGMQYGGMHQGQDPVSQSPQEQTLCGMLI